jgi:cation diffusion facilitator family transporter
MQETAKNYYLLSRKISWVGILVNLALSIVKFIIGLVSNSVAIIADAFHSLSDIVTTAAAIISLKFSAKPADKKHPFGHGRLEDVGGLFIAFILGVIGFGFFYNSVSRLFKPESVNISELIIVIVTITAVVKLILGVFTHSKSLKIGSDILYTDAMHHYSDFFTSLVIALGSLFTAKGLIYIDSCLGILVAIVIIIWSFKLGKQFVDNLIGRQASPEIIAKIKTIASAPSEVKGVNQVNVHRYGRLNIISLHIILDGELRLRDAHQIADWVEKSIKEKGLGNSIVHVDPLKYRE